MLRALELRQLRPEQLRRLRETLDRLLAEARGWTDAQKQEALDLARKWLDQARARRTTKEAARLRERAGADEFTPAEQADLFQDLADETAQLIADTAARVGAGEITPHQFYLDMERYITLHWRAAYIVGKVAAGGDEKLTRSEEKALWAARNEQIKYLNKFYQAVRDGQLSAAQIGARAGLYARAIQAPYHRGQAGAYGDLRLPQVPGDGKTRCRTNCQCRLRYELVHDADGNVVAVNVYWELGVAEHCDDCIGLAARWNPLRVEV